MIELIRVFKRTIQTKIIDYILCWIAATSSRNDELKTQLALMQVPPYSTQSY